MKQLKIGITDCGKYDNYAKWLLDTESNADVIKLSHRQKNADRVKECDGIILSGGEDVHPALYNKPQYLPNLNLKEINEERDNFELNVIDRSFVLKKPVLGICRGLQIVNVFLGGTLIYDIPAVAATMEHGKVNGVDQRHAVDVVPGSLLYKITGKGFGEINSAHHQSVDRPAEELRVIAQSTAIVEAMEWKNSIGRAWLLLVQWHPERMFDQENPFAHNIKNEFIKAAINQ